MKKVKYEVVMEQVNYLGEVNETNVIATFESKQWAEEFLNKCCVSDDLFKFSIRIK